MIVSKISSLIIMKINNFIIEKITSTLLLVVFLSLYVAIVGAIIGYFYFRKNKDSFKSYLNVIKHCPAVTKLLVKFWIELQSSFYYDFLLNGWIKTKKTTTKDNHELKEILNNDISFDEINIVFESTTLYLLINTKDYFRFK